jgi:hypothetical protein
LSSSRRHMSRRNGGRNGKQGKSESIPCTAIGGEAASSLIAADCGRLAAAKTTSSKAMGMQEEGAAISSSSSSDGGGEPLLLFGVGRRRLRSSPPLDRGVW